MNHPHGLERHHALAQTSRAHHADSVCCRPAGGLLAGHFTPPLEISRRSRSGAAAGVAADRARILHPARARTAQSHRTVLRDSHGTSSAILFSRTARRLGALQPAVYGPTLHGGVRGRGPQARRSLVVSRRIARGHLLPRHSPALMARCADRHDSQLRAHHRRVGVVLMVGGNLPGVTRTVSISIYDSMQSLDYAAAGKTSLLLLVMSFVILAFTYALQRTVWIRPRQ